VFVELRRHGQTGLLSEVIQGEAFGSSLGGASNMELGGNISDSLIKHLMIGNDKNHKRIVSINNRSLTKKYQRDFKR